MKDILKYFRHSSNRIGDGCTNNRYTLRGVHFVVCRGMKLIKSDLKAVSEPAPTGAEEDQLQKRLKEEEEQKFPKFRHSAKYAELNKDRRLNKSSSPLEITEIRPYLLLCGAVALRGNVLQDLNVTCVVNATNELPDTPLPCSPEILYLRVSVDDKSDSDIASWLDVVTDLIHQVKLAGGKTLIHCVAGISRSATLCLAYLIKYEGYSLHDSYVMLKTLRQIIRPNSGFFGQLVEFEKRITGKQTVIMIHSDYTKSCIPHLYEDDYKLYTYRCLRTSQT